MQGGNIHILSTGDIPAFYDDSASITVDVLPFQEITLKTDAILRQRINRIAAAGYSAIFTSANAVRAVAGLLENKSPAWNCFCVGEKSKQLLLKLMPDSQVLATADLAAELSKKIIRRAPSPLVFFSGNLRREELPSQLKTHNIPFEELVVYATTYTAIELKKHYHGILFFSPGAVNAYFQANKPDAETVLFAIGPTTESALQEQTKNKIITTDRPDKSVLVKMALQYFEAY